jgi:hypothetical protein
MGQVFYEFSDALDAGSPNWWKLVGNKQYTTVHIMWCSSAANWINDRGWEKKSKGLSDLFRQLPEYLKS